MLQVTIPAQEYVVQDSAGNVEFITIKEQKLWLEHSLISVQKWEAKWHKVYLDPDLKLTREEANDYVRCMIVKPAEVDPNALLFIPDSVMKQINAYISDPMTATTFTVHGKPIRKGKPKKVSAEVLYWQMSVLDIPFECRTWHLNQLLTMIHLFDIKNGGGKKLSKKEQAEWQRSKMAAARSKYKKR